MDNIVKKRVKAKYKNNDKSVFAGKEFRKGYTIVDNEIILEDNLSIEAIYILIYVLQKPNNWYFTRKTFMDRLKCGNTKVAKILKELKDNGYLTIHQFPNPDRTGYTTKYRFYTGECRDELLEKQKQEKTDEESKTIFND